MKWEKEENKTVIECWIKSEPSKRKYRQRMKKIWDGIGVFPVTEQRLADQARQIQVNKWLTDTDIEEIDRRCRDIIHEEETCDSTDNEGSREEKQGAQGNGIDQRYVMEIQVDIDQEYTGESSMGQNGRQRELQLLEEIEGDGVFPEDDEMVVGRGEIERYDEEEKELLRKVLNEIRQNPEKIPPNLRCNDRKKVKAATIKVKKVIALIRTESITETNIVLRAAGNVVAEMAGHKTRNPKENRTPHWGRRILEKQKALRKDLGQLNRMKRNELENEGTKSKLEIKYRIEEKGIVVVHEEEQQRLVATGAKLGRYDNKSEQYRQNRLFESNQKKLFDELDGVERKTVVPDAEESTRFWSNIWGKPVKHKDNPEWLRNVEEELTGLGVQDNIHIEVMKLKKQVRKMPNWKSPGHDGVQGY